MRASDFIDLMNDIMKRHGDLELVYAGDDEGNYFNKLVYAPTAGHYDGESFNDDPEDDMINSICIN